MRINQSDSSLHRLTPLALLLVTGCIVASCAGRGPSTQEITRAVTGQVPSDRIEEVRIVALISDGSIRREMRQSDDPVAWLDNFWQQRDPTPSTPENEALQVYLQRAEFLQNRFPELVDVEWPELMVLFLKLGSPDWQGPEYVVWPRADEEGQNRTIPTISGGFQWERMRYSTPREFTLVVEDGKIRKNLQLTIPNDPPSLEGVWEILEGSTASASQRIDALTAISWYELPAIASRLLNIPASGFAGIQDQYMAALERLSVRSAYRLGVDGIRRLAALRAAGATPELCIRRAMSGSYSLQNLLTDLRPLSWRRNILARGPNRGPHPLLWLNPEGLLESLTRDFPASHTMTGWDWQGDVFLAFGPPAYLDINNREVRYLWGTPEILGIGDTMLGKVDATRLDDQLASFIREAAGTIERRRIQENQAANIVTNALTGGGADQVTRGILDQLHVLAPPLVYSMGLPAGVRPLPISMDIVAFPTETDSVEVQATFGVPANAVRMRTQDEFLITDLRTNLLFIDHDLNAIHAEIRQEGYVINTSEGTEGRFFLDTYRFKIPPGSYIAYLSAEDPNSESSGAAMVSVDLTSMATNQLQVSPILLASDIQPAEDEGKFVRGGLQILPAPSRRFLYGDDLYFYYEVDNLSRSDVGDYVISESLFIIPNDTNEGIITISSGQNITGLEPSLNRSMGIDLSSLGRSYEGTVHLVVLVTDQVTGEQAVGATLLVLRRPVARSEEPPPGDAPDIQ
ncbi:GWxTD domain-containing protein [Gemmatimonadota bacterium]